MADRISKLKRDDRRIPKASVPDGPRRLSHGVIGVKKVRRTSDKSDRSNPAPSRVRSPFSDLVPTQTRSSISVLTAKNSETGQTTHLRRKSATPAVIMSAKKVDKKSFRDRAIQQILSTSLSQKATPASDIVSRPTKVSALPDTSIVHADHSYHEFLAPAIESFEVPPPAQDETQTYANYTRSPSGTLQHGFVQVDDDQALESMAMDKIDRFLESLGGSTTTHKGAYDPNPSLGTTKNSDSGLASPVPHNGAFITSKILDEALVSTAREPASADKETDWYSLESDTSSVSQGSSNANRYASSDDGLPAATRSEVNRPNTRPLSVNKSPSSNTVPKLLPANSIDDAPADAKTFRGVEVDWLLQMYNDYMAAKPVVGPITESNEPSSESSPPEGSSSKLRPLLLPAVVGTTDTSTRPQTPPVSPSRLPGTSIQGSGKSPTKKLTFGAPRTSPPGQLRRLPTPSPNPPIPPAAVPEPSATRPILQRNNTGVSQQDAAEIVRNGLISPSKHKGTDSSAYVPQVLEATTLLKSTSLPRVSSEGSQDSSILQPAIAKKGNTTVSRPIPEPIVIPARVERSVSPVMSANAPQISRRPTSPLASQAVGSGKAESRISVRNSPQSLTIVKGPERKRIVSNNVSFYDPFEKPAKTQDQLTPSPTRGTFTISPRDIQFPKSTEKAAPKIDAVSISAKPKVQSSSADSAVRQTADEKRKSVESTSVTLNSGSRTNLGLLDLEDDTDEELLAYPATPKINQSAKQVKMLGLDSSASETSPILEEVERSGSRKSDASSSDDDLLPKTRRNVSGISSKASKILGMSENVKQLVAKEKRRTREKASGKHSAQHSSSRKLPSSGRSHYSGTSTRSGQTGSTFDSQMTITSILSRSSASTVRRQSMKSSTMLVEPLSLEEDVEETNGLALEAITFNDSNPVSSGRIAEQQAKTTSSGTYLRNSSVGPDNSHRSPAPSETLQISPEITPEAGPAGIIPIVIDEQITQAKNSPPVSTQSLFEHYRIDRVAPAHHAMDDESLVAPPVVSGAAVVTDNTIKDPYISLDDDQPGHRTSSCYSLSSHADPTSPVVSTEPETNSTSVFGNYQLNATPSKSYRSEEAAYQMTMSPSTSQFRTASMERFSSPAASIVSRNAGTNQAVEDTTSKTSETSQSIEPVARTAERSQSDRDSSKKPLKYSGARLSAIEQSPLLSEKSFSSSSDRMSGKQTTSTPDPHALGLELSRPKSSDPLNHILSAEKQMKGIRTTSNRLSTLDRINQTALPSRVKSPARLDTTEKTNSGRQTSAISPTLSAKSFERSGEIKSTSRNSNGAGSVPISYYVPNSANNVFDPFRNLDMKALSSRATSPDRSVASTSSTSKSLPKKLRPVSMPASAIPQQQVSRKASKVYTRSERGSIFYVDAKTKEERNYITKPVQPTLERIPEPAAINPVTIERDFVPRTAPVISTVPKKPRPVSMSPTKSDVNRVNQPFDIRRAIAMSDDGEDNWEDVAKTPNPSAAKEEDSFGMLASTASQAFSKWFG